jgi:hypothetical protein
MRLKEIYAHMDSVSVELRISELGGERLRADVLRDPTVGQVLNLSRGEITTMIDRLDHTYIVRVFAVFEWALRELWGRAFRRQTEPPVRDLIDALAAARGFMPTQFLDRAHEVREFRNSVVHVNATSDTVFTFPEAHAHLKAYLSHMPREW